VAGRGDLPFEVIRTIHAQGRKAAVIGLSGEADPELSRQADRFDQVNAGNLEMIIQTLQQSSPLEIVLAGKVGKEALFGNELDPLMRSLLKRLPQKNDDAVLGGIVALFAEAGLAVARQTAYLQHLLAETGSIVGEISAAEMTDIILGFQMAKAIGGLDIGQSVVVKGGIVLAAEAIEGTDQAILRGGRFASGAVVVKVSKPQQDERFDVPTVGRRTIRSMVEAKAAVLAVEAGKTLLTERSEMLEMARTEGIKITGVDTAMIAGTRSV
jgi:UDP-2,3-diacylglucosamine hydrolase